MTYKMCTRCVMDTTDPEIQFDSMGQCNHCTTALESLEKYYFPNAEGERRLQAIIQEIKKSGEGKPYDCLIGISGGVDSSWLTYKSKEWGLRPLIFHVDGGWNSEAAQQNIEALLKYLDYDLYTHVVDWEEMRDLQRAYFKSALANQDVPQDHIFFGVLFKKAAELGINYWLSGGNMVSESILPSAWGYSAQDSKQLLAVHKKFGEIELKNYMTLSFFEYCKYYKVIPRVSRVHAVNVLDLMPYSVAEAKKVLEEKIGWKSYARKHGESRFTKFFQNYYLPTKFGYDKRKAHLSSLIISGEISRDEALEQLELPLYEPNELLEDKEFILKKLNFTHEEWDEIMALPNQTFKSYPNWQASLKTVRGLVNQIRAVYNVVCPKSIREKMKAKRLID